MTLLGGWVRRFLLEHLVSEKNLARNTQQSYRDTLYLLLPFLARSVGKNVDRLLVLDLAADHVRQFLSNLEEKRGCGVATRNQRLAALRSLAHFIGLHSPEHVDWCGQIRSVPFKKAPQVAISYLEKSELDALLAAPDVNTAQGRHAEVDLQMKAEALAGCEVQAPRTRKPWRKDVGLMEFLRAL
jgi:site-specific recombinase XerD